MAPASKMGLSSSPGWTLPTPKGPLRTTTTGDYNQTIQKWGQFLKSYFSGGWVSNMKKVEAYVAVEITPGPHLVEESVKDLSYGFTRNIVGWPESEKTWQHGSIAIQKVFAIRDTFAQNYLVGKETV